MAKLEDAMKCRALDLFAEVKLHGGAVRNFDELSEQAWVAIRALERDGEIILKVLGGWWMAVYSTTSTSLYIMTTGTTTSSGSQYVCPL